MPPVANALTIAQLFANAAQASGDRPASEDDGIPCAGKEFSCFLNQVI